jgi:hypothetical protein
MYVTVAFLVTRYQLGTLCQVVQLIWMEGYVQEMKL